MTEFNPGGAASLNQAVKLRYEANADTNAFTDAEKAKLSGIAAGATVNASDAALRDRATHSGEQPIASVTGLQGALDGKAAAVHAHIVADVTGLQAALDGKAAATHGHPIADVGGLQAALDAKAAAVHGHAVADVSGLQAALDGKAAAVHGHVIADVTGLQGALDGKAAAAHGHAIGDVTGLQTALDGKAATGHTHAAADIANSSAAGRAMLTAADAAAQTALLDTFTGGAKGLVPASGGGTTTFLRADGTFAAPPGGGGGSGDVVGPASSEDTEVPRFDGTTGKLLKGSPVRITDNGTLRLPANPAPGAPPADVLALFGARFANRMYPGFIGPSGLDSALQPLMAHNKIAYFGPAGNSTSTAGVFGMAAPTATGTATARNVAAGNIVERSRRLGYVSAATAGSVAGTRATVAQITTGDGSGLGGFFWSCRFAIAAHTADANFFMGPRGASSAPTGTTAITALTNAVGIGFNGSMSNMHIVYGGSSFQTPIDLGADFPARTASVDLYELNLFAPPNVAGTVHYHVRRLNTNHNATGTLSGNATVLPQSGTLLSMINAFINNQATAAAVAFDLVTFYCETDY